jgi:hypothetical protein
MHIFLSNYWWQESDIWSQVSYRYAILWEAFLDPSDSYFLFAEERGYHKWALAHSSSCYRISKWDPRCCDCMVVVSSNSLRQAVLNTTLCDTVCQWLTISRWFSLGTPVSSTNKTDRHDIAEILLKVALNTITLTSRISKRKKKKCYLKKTIIFWLCFRAWLEGVMPLVIDRESTLQEKCMDQLEEIILHNIVPVKK